MKKIKKNKCEHCKLEFDEWKIVSLDFPLYAVGGKIKVCPICGISEEEFA